MGAFLLVAERSETALAFKTFFVSQHIDMSLQLLDI